MDSIKAGTVEGTGSAINVSVGFAPSYVKLYNLDDADGKRPEMEWWSDFTDGYALKRTARVDIPVPLATLRESVSDDITNIAANGGLLAKDTTPNLEMTNGDTDSALRLDWAASNSDPIVFQVPLPADLDVACPLVIKFRAAMAGTTDEPTIASDVYFNEGDTKVEDVSAAVTGTTYAEYTITVAAADIPAGARTMTVELTPGAHTTDILYMTNIMVEAAGGSGASCLVTSGGISDYVGAATAAKGFTIGTDSDMNVSAETIHYLAVR